MKLQLWKGLLWGWSPDGSLATAYCPEHRARLDIETSRGLMPQSAPLLPNVAQAAMICPIDGAGFPIGADSFKALVRHYKAALESQTLKDAEILDLDGFQVPIVKADPPNKDDEYWAQVRINDTKRGKQLVVYAGKRGAGNDKTQIFLDVENDKITFDQNNMHPNDVFFKLTGEFKSGRKVTLEDQ